MQLEPVDSSNVRAIGYDPVTQTLRVEFHNGGVYDYSGVPPYKHQELMAAGSKGSHLHNNIKGQHEHRRIE